MMGKKGFGSGGSALWPKQSVPTDDNELLRILKDHLEMCLEDGVENLSPDHYVQLESRLNQYIAQKQKEAIEKVVGEDEPETELKEFNNPPFGKAKVGTVLGKNVARNELRAEQRAKLKTLSSEGEDE